MDAMKQQVNIGELLTRYKEYVIIAVTVVVSLIAAKYIYNKQMMEYERLKEDINVEQEKSGAIERIVAIDNKIKDLKKEGWDTTEFDAISSRIGELARKRDIKILNVNPIDKIVESNYIRIPFKINAEGRTEDVIKFMRDIETYPKLTRVQRVSLDPLRSGDDTGTASDSTPIDALRVDMTVTAYYFK
ncbi:hypothetical protein BU251_05215 [Candidatus Velamenicoccus archaeovorus]|uniref:Type IV pilus biogenesis protein PilO n=1 Tax=Velamenicoccus archaeovorus TaxID=1930593 RepID=A0A410P520_VELA1|nr:type 4a pilus biogenesis protein PilO [Candidatus Velamenicoccus archaeovorus]QAT17171.1 hypothetical protein BU251_05215 [Candidatus Velamenicoccus archaeovorus]